MKMNIKLNLKQIALGALAMFMLTTGLADQQKRVLIYGHRGARGLVPENTMPAYKEGLAIGIDYVDMDVGMSKDGVVVVCHNFALNPDITRDKDGKWISKKNPPLLSSLTWQEIQSYDVGRLRPGTIYAHLFPDQKPIDGTHMPTLKEVIEYVKSVAGDNMNYQVEIKTDPKHPEWTRTPAEMAAAVVKILQDEGIDDRTDLQAFDWRVLQEVQKLDPKIATAYLTEKVNFVNLFHHDPKVAGLYTAGYLLKDYDGSLPNMISRLGGKVWGAESSQLNAENVATAHRYGLRVVPWTIDSEKEMIRMYKIGVDAIITDRPDLAHKVYGKLGMQLPQAVATE